MMVRALHAAGLEVILDVVYNHTAEGNHLGPTLSLRGIDNASYYRLLPDQPRYYQDFTGCGNTLNMRSPRVLQLIMDSLRYWVQEMHVDGFRFDLASALARELHAVDKLGAFFDIIHQDPVLSQVKLIAEPWDLGEGGYQVGNFPTQVDGVERQVSRYRAPVLARRRRRRLGAGDAPLRQQRSLRAERPAPLREHQLRHRARRLHAARSGQLQRQAQRGERRRTTRTARTTTSAGTAASKGRRPIRHILELRARQRRNLLATLMMSVGVPMISGGDEIGAHPARQQQRLLPGQRDELDALGPVGRAARLAGLHAPADPHLEAEPGAAPAQVPAGPADPRRGRGRHLVARAVGRRDDRRGVELARRAHASAMRLNGDAIDEADERGERVVGDTLLVLFNAGDDAEPFVLPDAEPTDRWESADRYRGSVDSGTKTASRGPVRAAAHARWRCCGSGVATTRTDGRVHADGCKGRRRNRMAEAAWRRPRQKIDQRRRTTKRRRRYRLSILDLLTARRRREPLPRSRRRADSRSSGRSDETGDRQRRRLRGRPRPGRGGAAVPPHG